MNELEVLVWACDPGNSPVTDIRLYYDDSDGPYVEIRNDDCGSMRISFSCNPDALRRFFRDGHKRLGDP